MKAKNCNHVLLMLSRKSDIIQKSISKSFHHIAYIDNTYDAVGLMNKKATT